MMKEEWYLHIGGDTKGPFTSADVRGFLKNGMIRSSDLVWKEGMSEWQAVAGMKKLSAINTVPLLRKLKNAWVAAPGFYRGLFVLGLLAPTLVVTWLLVRSAPREPGLVWNVCVESFSGVRSPASWPERSCYEKGFNNGVLVALGADPYYFLDRLSSAGVKDDEVYLAGLVKGSLVRFHVGSPYHYGASQLEEIRWSSSLSESSKENSILIFANQFYNSDRNYDQYLACLAGSRDTENRRKVANLPLR